MDKLPPSADHTINFTTAVFANQQACESAGKSVAKVRPESIRWWCVPQNPTE